MKLYLSHTDSVDSRTTARVVADGLEQAGHDVSVFAGGITGGDNWKQDAEKAICESDWLVALFSRSYTDSPIGLWERLVALGDTPILYVIVEPVKSPFELHPLIDITDVDIDGGVERIVEFLAKQEGVEEVEQSILSDEEIATERAKLASTPLPDRIFIAYSRRQRGQAKELADMLTGAGRAVFYDAKIKAGAVWRQTIQKALDDATHVLIVWTQEAAESDEVEREVSYALSEGKVIIPILGKEIPKLPYHLHGLHYVVLEDDLAAIEDDIIKAIEKYATEEEDIWE